jgi:hypothetical protein
MERNITARNKERNEAKQAELQAQGGTEQQSTTSSSDLQMFDAELAAPTFMLFELLSNRQSWGRNALTRALTHTVGIFAYIIFMFVMDSTASIALCCIPAVCLMNTKPDRFMIELVLTYALQLFSWPTLLWALTEYPKRLEFTAYLFQHPLANEPGDWRPLHALLYLFLVESFFHGALLHPCGGYFMGVHNTHVDDDPNSKAKPKECQPTRSHYSWLASVFSLNLNFHVEHHDFPNIPWSRLPRLRQIAPEFYDPLVSYTGLTHTIWDSIIVGKPSGYACT